MTELQELLLEILLKFDDICQKNNLRYYLAYGTCIGAVRHQGFIPWDHDIDVLMPIEDAKKLEQCQSDFGDRFFVKSYRTDQGYKAVNMQIVDTQHKCNVILKDKIIDTTNVAMDIYPFYNCPRSRISLTICVIRSHIYKMLVGGVPKNHGNLAKLLSGVILALHNKDNRQEDIKWYESKMSCVKDSLEVADYYGQDITLFNVITYKKEWFHKPQKLLFEGRYFDGPTDPDKYLTKRYGDYMTPPSRVALENEVKCELIE